MFDKVKQIQFVGALLCVAASGFSAFAFAASVNRKGSETFAVGMALLAFGGTLECYRIYTQLRSDDPNRHPMLHALSRLAMWGALAIFFVLLIGARAKLPRY